MKFSTVSFILICLCALLLTACQSNPLDSNSQQDLEVESQLPVESFDQLPDSSAQDYASCPEYARCGNLIAYDCGMAADGILYYVNQDTQEVLATCGGNCMAPDMREYCQQNCPPAAWTCE